MVSLHFQFIICHATDLGIKSINGEVCIQAFQKRFCKIGLCKNLGLLLISLSGVILGVESEGGGQRR